MAAGEIVLLVSVALGSAVLGSCTPREELIDGATRHWRAIFICTATKCLVLPAIAWALSILLGLDRNEQIGMAILSAVPSSPISNLWQWLSVSHVGLGAVMTFASNLASLAAVPLTLSLYLGRAELAELSLRTRDALLYLTAYSAPIAAASFLVYMLLPKDQKEIHYRWKLLALMCLVMFTFIAFAFVGSDPLGMNVNPWDLLAGHALKDYAACLIYLFLNLAVGYGTAVFFKLPPMTCRTMSIETAMQNDWLALHIVRGSGNTALAFPILLYSTLQTIVGPMVMVFFRQLYQWEQVDAYIAEQKLHDSFKGKSYFSRDADEGAEDLGDAAQVSLQSRHNDAVSRIFGMPDMGTRYGKSTWHLGGAKKDGGDEGDGTERPLVSHGAPSSAPVKLDLFDKK